jgi:SAM-dependent methyltransferase
MIHRRDKCRLCGSPQLEMVVQLGRVPLPHFETRLCDALTAETYPIDLYMCGYCAHVQVLDVPEAVWSDYSYHNGQAKVMLDHFAETAKKVIEKYKPAPGSLVVDIGSNDGSFLRHFKDAGYRVVGVELVKEIAEAATRDGIETVGEALSPAVAKAIRAKHGPASVILAFNVFAHTDNLDGMAWAVKDLLADDGVFVFEAQYLMDIVHKTLIATVFHEHLSHHALKPMREFLQRFGMDVVSVERVPIQHGSIIGYVRHRPCKIDRSVVELLALEETVGLNTPKALRGFGRQVDALRANLRDLATSWKAAGATVAAYGAARSGPGLMEMLGLRGAIQYIVDDHPQKVGRHSPVHGIPVVPTSELLARMPDYTVLLAWVPAQAIIKANQEYLRRGGKFVVLCPDFRVVECLEPAHA